MRNHTEHLHAAVQRTADGSIYVLPHVKTQLAVGAQINPTDSWLVKRLLKL